MKFIFLLLFLFFSNIKSPELGGKVISIKDGDTIVILFDNTQTKIRLNEIDCPEMGQAFGQQAKKYTSAQCFGKEVKVIIKGKDYFGRILGQVILPNKRILNYDLVANGLAWHFKKYSNSEKLAELESKARLSKKGLWAYPNPLPPWEFRKKKKNKISLILINSTKYSTINLK